MGSVADFIKLWISDWSRGEVLGPGMTGFLVLALLAIASLAIGAFKDTTGDALKNFFADEEQEWATKATIVFAAIGLPVIAATGGIVATLVVGLIGIGVWIFRKRIGGKSAQAVLVFSILISVGSYGLESNYLRQDREAAHVYVVLSFDSNTLDPRERYDKTRLFHSTLFKVLPSAENVHLLPELAGMDTSTQVDVLSNLSWKEAATSVVQYLEDLEFTPDVIIDNRIEIHEAMQNDEKLAKIVTTLRWKEGKDLPATGLWIRDQALESEEQVLMLRTIYKIIVELPVRPEWQLSEEQNQRIKMNVLKLYQELLNEAPVVDQELLASVNSAISGDLPSPDQVVRLLDDYDSDIDVEKYGDMQRANRENAQGQFEIYSQ